MQAYFANRGKGIRLSTPDCKNTHLAARTGSAWSSAVASSCRKGRKASSGMVRPDISTFCRSCTQEKQRVDVHAGVLVREGACGTVWVLKPSVRLPCRLDSLAQDPCSAAAPQPWSSTRQARTIIG